MSPGASFVSLVFFVVVYILPSLPLYGCFLFLGKLLLLYQYYVDFLPVAFLKKKLHVNFQLPGEEIVQCKLSRYYAKQMPGDHITTLESSLQVSIRSLQIHLPHI